MRSYFRNILNQLKTNFTGDFDDPSQNKLSTEEWKASRNLPSDHSIVAVFLVEKSNKIFNRLCSHRLISETKLKYFTYNFKKATNFGKLYFLPKIHKKITNLPGRPVVSNCGTPTEYSHLGFVRKPVIEDGWSYNRY